MMKELGVLVICSLIGSVIGVLSDEKCPSECDCYYFRINWVTDCSDSELDTIPYNELSLNVYVLDMINNEVEKLDPFPNDIKLRQLEMSFNRLTELSQESLAGLNYLLEADFSSNNIVKIDPNAFRDSPGLIRLKLNNNPLEKVPGNFLNSSSPLELEISNCNIQHLNDNFFEKSRNIKHLDLSNNPLKRLEEGTFKYLSHLESLKMFNCSLNHISLSAFNSLSNLRDLVLSNNNLMTVSWNQVLSPLIKLTHLDISNCKITNLSADAFANNEHLIELVLSHNELRDLDVADTLGHNLHSLYKLDLSYCSLQERLSEEAFKNASKLRILDLSGNPMFASDLTAVLRHVPKLYRLSLNNCSLEKLPNSFDVLTNLQELDISHNPLSDAFVKLLNPLKSLEYLDMSYCSLEYVGNNTFERMAQLRTLILSGNKLQKLEKNLFQNLTKLTTLEMINCGLKQPLNPDVFGTEEVYSSLIELNLSDNHLIIPDGPLLPKQLGGIEKLYLRNCNLTTLNSFTFDNNLNLTELNLANNNINGINNLDFVKKLSKLQKLDLSYNQLITINQDVFNNNNNLHSLNLIGNPFICNCSLHSMWDWASNEKKDLDILVGSQPLPTNEFQSSYTKLKKSLVCSFHPNTFKAIIHDIQLNKNDKKINKKLEINLRTWIKYIRETKNCCSAVVVDECPATIHKS